MSRIFLFLPTIGTSFFLGHGLSLRISMFCFLLLCSALFTKRFLTLHESITAEKIGYITVNSSDFNFI